MLKTYNDNILIARLVHGARHALNLDSLLIVNDEIVLKYLTSKIVLIFSSMHSSSTSTSKSASTSKSTSISTSLSR